MVLGSLSSYRHNSIKLELFSALWPNSLLRAASWLHLCWISMRKYVQQNIKTTIWVYNMLFFENMPTGILKTPAACFIQTDQTRSSLKNYCIKRGKGCPCGLVFSVAYHVTLNPSLIPAKWAYRQLARALVKDITWGLGDLSSNPFPTSQLK